MKRGISVVIPSWNGLSLLTENLPSVLEAIDYFSRHDLAPVELLVVDDGSQDATLTEIPRLFPEVELVVRPENGGFAKACNSGFRRCRQPLVALLNNDVQVEHDYLTRLAAPLVNPDVFAATARVFDFRPPLFATGGKVACFRRGFWAVYTNYDVDDPLAPNQPLWVSGYAVGGFACYDREKLLELGGFMELLSPFHWEDVDLSYRAWKRGWKVVYEPRARAFHEISATINTHFSKKRVEAASIRNRLLFHWVNLHSRGFLLAHCWMLLLKFLSRIWVADLAFYQALFSALLSLPEVRILRRQEKAKARCSDRDLAQMFETFWKTQGITIYHDRKDVQRRHPGVG